MRHIEAFVFLISNLNMMNDQVRGRTYPPIDPNSLF